MEKIKNIAESNGESISNYCRGCILNQDRLIKIELMICQVIKLLISKNESRIN